MNGMTEERSREVGKELNNDLFSENMAKDKLVRELKYQVKRNDQHRRKNDDLQRQIKDLKIISDQMRERGDYWNKEHSLETERADRLQKQNDDLAEALRFYAVNGGEFAREVIRKHGLEDEKKE